MKKIIRSRKVENVLYREYDFLYWDKQRDAWRKAMDNEVHGCDIKALFNLYLGKEELVLPRDVRQDVLEYYFIVSNSTEQAKKRNGLDDYIIGGGE